MGEESISLMVIRITVGISSDEDRTVYMGLASWRKVSRRLRAEINSGFLPAVGR